MVEPKATWRLGLLQLIAAVQAADELALAAVEMTAAALAELVEGGEIQIQP